MDSSRSSPYHVSAFNHLSRESHPSESYLDPIILYNPSHNPSLPPHPTQSPFINTHRRKIFNSITPKDPASFATPINNHSNVESNLSPNIGEEGNRSQHIVQKLTQIQRKIEQIQGFIQRREEKSLESKREIQGMGSRKQVRGTEEQEKQLLTVLRQKEQCRTEIARLKQSLDERNRKISDIQSKEKEKEMRLNKNMNIQLLAYQRDKAWLEYQRIKHGVVLKQGFQKEISRIKKRVQKQSWNRRGSESTPSSSFQIQQFTAETKLRGHQKKRVDGSDFPTQTIHQHQDVQVNLEGMASSPLLSITQSDIYPFEQESNWLLP